MLIQLLNNTPESAISLVDENAETPLILIQSGVYAYKTLLDKTEAKIYALEKDWKAAGLEESRVQTINYEQWVDLCAKHHPVITLQE